MSLICHGSLCSADEVGPFMQNISAACGNNGDCQLPDIMSVVANVGNYVLGLVGAVVLLMFVIGGFYFITAGGRMEQVKKGKFYITTSIVGLLIVFGAFAAIQTLRSVLTGTTATQNGGNFVLCDAGNDGAVCGLNEICKGGICMSQCDADNAGFSNVTDDGKTQSIQCIDTQDHPGVTVTSCQPNRCPGSDTIQCCIVTR